MKFGGRASFPVVSVVFVGCAGLNGSPNVVMARSPVTEPEGQSEPAPSNVTVSSLPIARPTESPAIPTWSTIYARYLSAHSDGGCARSNCHADVMGDPASAYSWLAQWGYIAGTRSPLVSTTNSCLIWFGGNMPPSGAPNDAARRDLTAWVAAGAPRN
jgi:hypothetical protein